MEGVAFYARVRLNNRTSHSSSSNMRGIWLGSPLCCFVAKGPIRVSGNIGETEFGKHVYNVHGAAAADRGGVVAGPY